jgi:hypothetical protein
VRRFEGVIVRVMLGLNPQEFAANVADGNDGGAQGQGLKGEVVGKRM